MARIHLPAAFIALVLLLNAYVGSSRQFPDQQCSCESRPGIWALLVTDSSYYPYEANVFHAYHTLRRNGVPEDHIITMTGSGFAYRFGGAHYGRVYNKVNGSDVYQGVRIDYRMSEVNSSNVLAVLQGNSGAVQGGNGRVIRSTEKDNIFVFYAGNGYSGYVNVPGSDYLHAYQLINTLKTMKDRRYFNKLVIYLDAHYSASMFEGILPSNINVYAMTSSRTDETTYFTECSARDLPCLATEFSRSWLHDSDTQQPDRETLQEQYEAARRWTNRSHVSRYGDLSMEDEFVAAFQGSQWEWMQPGSYFERQMQRPVDLMQQMHPHELQQHIDKHKQPVHSKIQEKRQYLDSVMKGLIGKLFNTTEKQQRVLNTSRGPIKNPECHYKILEAFHQKCFDLKKNPYAGEYSTVLSNMCNEDVNIDIVIKKMIDHCQGITVTNIE